MQKVLLLLLFTGMVLPAFAARRVTVEQLEQVLVAAHAKSDAKVAQQLSDLELTERLSAARLARWEVKLPGSESRRSLLVLADLSAFLDPPASEIPATATPDIDAQRLIVAQAISYAEKTISRLPDFFATRDTIRFEDTPPRQLDTGSADGTFMPYQPLHPVGRLSATIQYRDGKEVVEPEVASAKNQDLPMRGLTTSGVFGAILGTVLVDAARGKLAWSHWEQGTVGPVAVFRFAIPREKSHYQVEFCCVPGGSGNGVVREFSGYHGEMAVDPVNGAMFHLTVEADLKPNDPLLRSDILVEYGPVEIGGKTYICPVKSVSITVGPSAFADASELQRYRGELLGKGAEDARDHLQTLLNESTFGQYHLFRAETRILSGENAETNATAPLDSASSAPDASPIVEAEKPVAMIPAEGSAPLATAALVAADTPPQPTAIEPAAPEISATQMSGLAETAEKTNLGSSAGFTLRVTTRLVDVGVVAVDKKGHPVVDLKPEDFEIYDDGRKQAVRFFNRADAEIATVGDRGMDRAGLATDQPVFSNRRAELANPKGASEAAEAAVTILLIDADHLAWADLTYARGEMLRFLRSLPAHEPVALYAMTASGFQVLEEGATDHALLASRLTQWMPSAGELARANEMDLRNRQEFDKVLHSTDLQSVNGNIDMTLDAASGVDPNLRDDGSDPGRSAMTVLTGVARHLAAIPGHKSLVWITSDNVLADWTQKAVGTDKGSQHAEGYILRAQEAMNDAHVSVYPLDASRLETQAIDPSLKKSSVELDPSVTAPPPPHGGGQAGRIAAEMQQDLHPIQAAIQQMAEATGGHVFRRSGDIATNLNEAVEDGRAAYLLGFTPDTPADGRYHLLTVKLTGRRGVTLHYRTGYEYALEPTTLQDRLKRAMGQASDSSEIALSANPMAASEGAALKLNISASDLAMKQQGVLWVDELDIFLVQRDEGGLHARVSGQTLRLTLKPATYAKLLREGIPFDQFIEKIPDAGSVRILVVDRNSGSMGSVTIPAAALRKETLR